MDKKTEFKEFVKQHPELVKYVRSGEMNWQKFYEIYDLYGEKEEAWNNYFKKQEEVSENKATTAFGFTDILGWLKTVDLDSVQNSINSVQRVVSVLQDFGGKEEVTKPEYKPRPLYKHFED